MSKIANKEKPDVIADRAAWRTEVRQLEDQVRLGNGG